ncbi:MAG: DUF3438 family protein [Cellvibrionaceae bacterium]
MKPSRLKKRLEQSLQPLCFLIALLLTLSANADNGHDRVLWDKTPINVALSLNKERIIHFPTDVRYWVPEFLTDKISILSANGVLYIEAHEAFDKTRIRVQTLDSQKIYLLDLVSRDDGDDLNKSLRNIIVTDEDYINNQSVFKEHPPKKSDWFVRLVRFAAQSLYGEEERLPADSQIYRVKINPEVSLPLIRGSDVEAKPIAMWRGGGLYITAVLIVNTSENTIPIFLKKPDKVVDQNRIITLDSDIRGHWLAVVPQHDFLGEAGSDKDRTTLYLVSSRPFQESI